MSCGIIKERPLTHADLIRYLSYNPLTGVFIWREKTNKYSKIQIGDDAGYQYPGGYRNIFINGIQYKANRLAFYYMMGRWPYHIIDHIDTDKSNNRWGNLREATNQQNQFNRKAGTNNTSGKCGVYFDICAKRWQAYARLRGRRIHIGFFLNKEDAIQARLVWEVENHKEFRYNGPHNQAESRVVT